MEQVALVHDVGHVSDLKELRRRRVLPAVLMWQFQYDDLVSDDGRGRGGGLVLGGRRVGLAVGHQGREDGRGGDRRRRRRCKGSGSQVTLSLCHRRSRHGRGRRWKALPMSVDDVPEEGESPLRLLRRRRFRGRPKDPVPVLLRLLSHAPVGDEPFGAQGVPAAQHPAAAALLPQLVLAARLARRLGAAGRHDGVHGRLGADGAGQVLRRGRERRPRLRLRDEPVGGHPEAAPVRPAGSAALCQVPESAHAAR